jgi:ribonucleoside-diphosphate reductase alpha chain
MALQYGVPLDTLVDKFSHMRFEPSGFTGNKQIPFAKSIMDYLFRWLGLKFGRNGKQEAQLSLEDKAIIARTLATDEKTDDKTLLEREKQVFATQSDAPPCPDCGMILVRNGSCYKCLNCGMSYGCS